MKKLIYFCFLLFSWFPLMKAQVFINEGSNRNAYQIQDEDGENEDWIEIYNAGPSAISLENWFLSDNDNDLMKWQIPAMSIPAAGFRTIFCSGKDRSGIVDHWETAVLPTDNFRYIVPNAGTPGDWMQTDFNDNSWGIGQAGFGFSDGDDVTTVNTSSVAVYIRKAFDIQDTTKIGVALLHVDYDDGFIAYLNGVEIARINMTGLPAWNSYADGDHEAVMYGGGLPEKFTLDMDLIRSIWHQGTNVLALEVHNRDISSSDVSLIPFLSFGINDGGTYFQPTPDWFPPSSGSNYHANFKIDRGGEWIYLSDPSGMPVDSLEVGDDLALNYSNGKMTDGSPEAGIFEVATPGASNNTQVGSTLGYEPAPVFTMPAGFYDNAITVGINSLSPDVTIRYTLNGQEPDINSPVYNAPLAIPQSRILKARCFSNTGKLTSLTNTASYLIDAYEHTIPVLSVTMRQQDLYGAEGIYDNWWTDWKRHCHIEYFEAENHALAFEQDAAIKIDGGAGGSRSLPQKSFRVEPGHGTFGDGDLEYPLLASRPDRDHYATFYLRNGSNQYLGFPIKEAIESTCMGGAGTHNYYSAFNAIAVYLNGEFWGIYELREKQDADYYAQHDGADPDSLDLLSVSYWYGGQLRAVEGSTEPFWNDYNTFLSLNPNSPTYLQQVGQFLDLENYADYIMAEQWIGNTDWPWNNIKVHRSNASGWRWRYGLIDLEWAMQPNGWSDHNTDMIEYCIGSDPNIPHIRFWQNLMQHPVFHDYYINRFADLMNTTYHFDQLEVIEGAIFEEILPEMQYEYLRWGEGPSVAAYLNGFNQNHQTIRNAFFLRSPKVRSHLQNHYDLPEQVRVNLGVEPAYAGKIKISTITPDTYPWTGLYFDGVPVKIEAIPEPGYEFSFWENNELITDTGNPVFLDTITTGPIDFIAHFGSLKAKAPSEGELMVYPNPASGLLSVALPKDSGMLQKISMYNIAGQVLTLEYSLSAVITLDITAVPAGIYMVTAETDKGTYRAKIVKE